MATHTPQMPWAMQARPRKIFILPEFPRYMLRSKGTMPATFRHRAPYWLPVASTTSRLLKSRLNTLFSKALRSLPMSIRFWSKIRLPSRTMSR